MIKLGLSIEDEDIEVEAEEDLPPLEGPASNMDEVD